MTKLHEAMERTFRSIYANRGWFNGSGSGSLPENTEVYRAFVQNFLKTHDVKSVLDIGCGDWQSTQLMDWQGVNYTGIEIVPAVFERVRAQHTRDHIHFICADVTDCELPSADLVIIKDVLQHWPNDAVGALLKRLASYKYALITNTIESQDITDEKHPVIISEEVNHDIKLGEVRPIDLSKPPFNLQIKELMRYVSVKRHRPMQDVKSIALLKATK